MAKILLTLIMLLGSGMLSPSVEDDQACENQISNLVQNIQNIDKLNTLDLSVLLFTGKGVFDLGSNSMCELFQMHPVVLTIAAGVYMGVCIYPQCSLEYLNSQRPIITELIKQMLQPPPTMQLIVDFQDEASIQESNQNEVRTGYILTTLLLCFLGILAIVGILVQYSKLCDKH